MPKSLIHIELAMPRWAGSAGKHGSRPRKAPIYPAGVCCPVVGAGPVAAGAGGAGAGGWRCAEQ